MIEIAVGVIIGSLVVWFFKPKSPKVQSGTDTAVTEARIMYLETLRREIGNILLSRDPDLLVRAYRRAWRYQDDMSGAAKERAASDFQSLTHKIRHYPDFDLLGVRHVVTYNEAAKRHDADDIVERYLEINQMLLFLKKDIDDRLSQLGEDEFKVLLQSVAKIKDSDFRQRLAEAMQRYYSSSSDTGEYLDAEFAVSRLPYDFSPENRYGISVLQTGEFGVFTSFRADNDKVYEEWYRSDRLFEKTESLNT